MIFRKFKYELSIGGFLILGIVCGHLTSIRDENMVAPLSKNNTTTSNLSRNWSGSSVNAKKDLRFVKSGNKELDIILDKLHRGELPSDWNSELKKILELTESSLNPNQKKALLIFFTKWAAVDFEKAMKMAGKVGSMNHEIRQELLTQLAEKDTQRALAYYENNKESLVVHDLFLKNIAKNWAKKSPEEAFSWCNSINKNQVKGEINFTKYNALTAFMIGIFEGKDSATTMKYINRIESEHKSLPGNIVTEWGRINPDEVVKWIVTSENGIDPITMKDAINGIALTNLEMAEDLLSTLPETWRLFAIGDIARKVIQYEQSEEAALSWALTQIPLAQFDDYILTALDHWSYKDPAAAGQWIEKLPASQGKDKVISCYINSINNSGNDSHTFSKALELIQGIDNATERQSLQKQLSKKFNRIDTATYEK